MIDLDLLSYTSRKDKADRNLIRNVELLQNNIVLCVNIEHKKFNFNL